MSVDKITVIEAKAGSFWPRVAAVWQYRNFYNFLLVEITMKKFKDTLLGFWWLVLRPLIPAIITIILFTAVVPMNTDSVPYPIFFFSGFVVWNLFQSLVIFMPRTLLWMRGMMRRTYFPKLLVPMASVGPPMIELAVVVTVFAIIVGFFGVSTGDPGIILGWNLLYLPLCLVLALMFGIAVGGILSVLAVVVRDIVFSVSYFVQIFMFLTPVIYPLTIIPEQHRWLVLTFNPMAPLVETSRAALTGSGEVPLFWLAVSAGLITSFFLLAIAFFIRSEETISDFL